MDKNEIKKMISRHEGRRTSVYKDEKNHPTIGIGFNLDRQDARTQIEALGLNYEQVLSGNQSLNDEQINKLFDSDLEQAIKDTISLINNFSSLPGETQAVLVDMVFNLGKNKFAEF